MEAKKSEKANLENKKGLFLELGIVLALAMVLFAFEFKSYDKQEEVAVLTEAVSEVEEMVIQTQQEEPEPPKQEIELSTTEFEIVENDKEIENEFTFEEFDNDVDGSYQNTNVEIQMTEEVADDTSDEIFLVVEEMASFPGGVEAMNKYLSENLKYPEQAKSTGTSGKVYVMFVVEKDGSLTDVKVRQDIGSGCGEEAVRVVKSMPKWRPAKQRNKVVRMQFILPINFTLKG